MSAGETRPPMIFQAERATALTMLVAGLWLVMSPLRSARLGEIDDHQYVAMVGHGSRLALSRVPGLVWHAMTTFDGRFHPFFDVLLVFEVALAGVDAHLWYALRATLALSSLVAIYLLARQVLRPLWSAVVALILLGGPQSQTWVRLGPLEGESTAVLLFGVLLLVHWYRDERRVSLFGGLGLIWLAAMTKESFSPYALVFLFIVLAVMVFKHRMKPFSPAVMGLLVAVAILPVIGVALTYLRYGDPYVRPRTVRGALQAGWQIIVTPESANGWLLIVSFALVLVLVRRLPSHRLTGIRPYALMLAGALVVWLAPQAAIYASGGLQGRYFMPGIFFHIMVIGASIWLIDSQIEPDIVERSTSAAIAGLAIIVILPQLLYWRGAAQVYTHESITFQQRLNVLDTLIDQNHSLPLRFETSDSLSDYEPIVSVKEFLDWRAGRVVPAVVSVTAGRRSTPLEVGLRRDLSSIGSRDGSRFLPSSQVPINEPCIGVEFHVSTPTRCRYSVSFV